MALGSFSNGGLGFGVAFTLENDFSQAAQEIMRDMNALGGATDQMAAGIERSLNQMKIGAGMVAVGTALLAPLKMGADVRAEFQAYEVQFETLLKSAEAAQVAIGNIKQDAIDSPVFGTKSLVAANAALVSNGIEANRSRGLINDLGNALAGVGRGDAELTNMAANLQQIASNGKASSMDIKQFAMAGLPIYKMLSDSTGKSVEELREMDITLEDLESSFRHSAGATGMFYGATERAAKSTKGLKAALEDGIELTLERIGKALEPMTRGLYERLGAILERLREFAGSPIGAVIIRITAGFAVFLIVGGLVLILMGGLRFAAYNLAAGFAANTKAMIIQTMATKGLAAGFKQMAIATWAAVAPLLLIVAVVVLFSVVAKYAWGLIQEGDERMTRFGVAILMLLGPFGLIIGTIAALSRGFKELNEWEGDKGGLIGFFMRVAGVIRAVVEIWESFNGETFTLTEELASKLEAMGILDFVLMLGTWISRIKMFFMGFIDTLKAGWQDLSDNLSGIWDRLIDGVSRIFDKLGEVWSKLWQLFAPLRDAVGDLLEKLGFGKGALADWGNAGSIMGDVIIFALTLIIDTIGLVIDIIIFVIETVLLLVEAFLDGCQYMQDGMFAVIDSVWGFMQTLWELITFAYDFGVDFMTSIWEGFKAIWENISTWLMETVGRALNILSDPLGAAGDLLGGIGNTVGGWFGGDNPDETNPVAGGGGANPAGGRPSYSNFTSKTVMAGAGSGNGGGNQPAGGGSGNETYNMPVYLDGEKIADNVISKQELKSNRK